MMALWIGIALLSASWLWALGIYYPANGWLWTLSIVAGAACLCAGQGRGGEIPASKRMLGWAAVAALLAPWLLPWPYLAAPIVLALGAVASLLANKTAPLQATGGVRYLGGIGRGLVLGGAVLSAQAVAIAAYVSETARNHDLPAPLAQAMGWLLGLVGFDASANGSTVFLSSLRQTHRMAATWDTLLDPATWCFFIGSVAALAVVAWCGEGFRWWRSAVLRLAAVCAVWLPLRALLLLGIYLQRVERTSFDAPLHAMNHYFATWVLLTLLLVPAAAAWRFIGRKLGTNATSPAAAATAQPRWRLPAAAALAVLGMAIVAMGTFWEPAGGRKQGRVKVVERHSTWEPTTRRYDTSWYAEPSGYNYALIYDQLAHYYDMSRLLETDAINDKTLADCDVLVIKTPTARYEPSEVAAVQRFVERGGGLLLIGDHTNLDRGSTTMNDITRAMGFIFRDDLLFCFGDATYDQPFAPPWAAHPAVRRVPPWVFAVSCSIDPGNSDGRPVIAGRGLFSMGPEYHAVNFHPVPEHCGEMRSGAFVQAWGCNYGKGRALAFTDSTILSNFCVMQEGKAELVFGMVEWLNHARPLVDPRPWLWLLGAALLAGGMWLFVGAGGGAWLLLVGALWLGWAVGGTVSDALNARALPPLKPQRPLTKVVVDREVSDVPLAQGAYNTGEGRGFGLLEQWISRLGYFTSRQKGDAVFSGDVLVVLEPHAPQAAIPEQYRQKLVDYVREGGKLLLIDSADNSATTANSLLWPFELSIVPGVAVKGPLTVTPALPTVSVSDALEIEGGTPVAKIGSRTVAAYAKYGRGAVLAVGCGTLFRDQNMGESWMTEPSPEVRQRYEILYALVRKLVEDKEP